MIVDTEISSNWMALQSGNFYPILISFSIASDSSFITVKKHLRLKNENFKPKIYFLTFSGDLSVTELFH